MKQKEIPSEFREDLAENHPEGIGVVDWNSTCYVRNEPVGVNSFQAVLYCRSCKERWESCSCEE